MKRKKSRSFDNTAAHPLNLHVTPAKIPRRLAFTVLLKDLDGIAI
jgi:hypothetical protein